MKEDLGSARRPLCVGATLVGRLAACCLLLTALVAVAGCSGSGAAGTGPGSADASSAVGASMAGPVVDINVSPEAIAAKPKPPVLTTPESAVRSYLDWTSYAYRIGQSQFAKDTMTSYEEVRVDSYVQYNIQQSRLIDQTLDSITFGTPAVEASHTVLPAKEKWTYRYVSIEKAGETIEGPYSVTYDSKYTVVKTDTGDWVVDSVEAKALDEVK